MSGGGEFSVSRDGVRLSGEEAGEGPPVVLLHGLTANRRYVVHGSRILERRGHRVIAYDARGHGRSDPAPAGRYGYPDLVADLGAMVAARCGGPALLAGSSMGAHTLLGHALADPAGIAGLVVIGPSYDGELPGPDEQRRWDALADGLAERGIDGFVDAYATQGLDPRWSETLVRLARERLATHRDLEALAHSIREVSRSRPFDDVSELERLDVPALVIASLDDADPGHPYAVAERYAERMPNARLIVEDEGDSPLAWQGGKLSREIDAFCAEPAVAERYAA